MNPIIETNFWEKVLFNNNMHEYGVALAVFLGLIIIFSLFQKYILKRLDNFAKQTKTKIDDAVIEIFRSIKPPFYLFIAFYIAINTLDFSNFVNKIIGAIVIIWVVYLAIKAVQIFTNYIFQEKIQSVSDRGTKSAIGAINIIVKIVLWSVGFMMVLSNLGIDITSLIAGLGVGGIAIAFALQNILSDLFSSFAIYFDKPFVIGDFIVIGDKSGTVEKIGIKTTRIRALQGEEIIISNNELTSARIQNFKKMEKRRVVFSVGVLYETPSEKLKKIPQLIKDIINQIADVKVDRVHFNKFADSALEFEISYYVESADFVKNMDVRQDINFRIKEKFEELGVEMAYPTQTLYVKK